MADNMRWRYGETNPVVLPVDSGTTVEIGDIVFLDTDDVKPAVSIGNLGSKAANQEGLHDQFAGIAMQRSRVGDTAPIRVATTGVFELDCAAATFEVGTLVGAAQPGSDTTLSNQLVATVATENLAIGRCAARLNPAGTTVLISVTSTVMYGGPQAKA